MRMSSILPLTLAVLMSGGCATGPADLYTGLPEQLPMGNVTDGTPWLGCLGEVLAAEGTGPSIDVLVEPIIDGTRPPHALKGGFLSMAGRRMARTGLAQLTPRVEVIAAKAYRKGRTTLRLRGAFTELDRVVASGGGAVSVRVGPVEVELDASRTWDVLVVDLELTDINGRQLPGLATSLAVVVDVKNGDAEVLLTSLDNDPAVSVAGEIKSVGRRHGAQRLLIEMGMLTLFSRYFGLEMTACLDNPDIGLERRRTLVRQYRAMEHVERVTAIQQLLADMRCAVGAVDGILGKRSRRAIRWYQMRRLKEPPTGQISPHLFVELNTRKKGC